MNYNWFRTYDQKTGRYDQVDPISVGEHVQMASLRMKLNRIYSGRPSFAHSQFAPSSWGAGGPLELNPFAYVADNPLRWVDPTGQGVETVATVLVIGGVCLTLYCTTKAKEYCEAAYPSSGGLDNDRKRMKCVTERIKVCATFGFYLMDPIGSASSTIGEEIGKKNCKECEGEH